MDIIITAIGEFIWTASCAVVNFCVSSGVSVVAVFVSLLCATLASAFYSYTINREQMSQDDVVYTSIEQENNDLDKPITIIPTTESSIASSALPATTDDELSNTNAIESLAEIEIYIEENINTDANENGEKINTDGEENGESINTHEEENHQEVSNDLLIDTIEGSEEEIQKQQIANIYRLLNDQNLINNWTATDFLDQLKMYGLQTYEEEEPQSS